MTHPTMDTEAFGRIAAAHLEAADALHRLVEAINSGEATARLSEAEPEPAASRWITDRVPEWEDADDKGNVQIPSRIDRLGVWVHWSWVHPGTPWAPINASPPLWDPTTLDRNGWIRSRLPTAADTGYSGQVLIPVGDGKDTATIHHLLIVQGQPWAPWASGPSSYQP